LREQAPGLVYYEPFDGVESAIRREASLKRWPCPWKIALIERDKP
jgi:predicted GIY-YIG superfamily endonuclease